MGVKNNVFASKSERSNFYKLSREWSEKYRIHHNLPFLNVFNTENLLDLSNLNQFKIKTISLTDIEISRLKKTSIDYTLCDNDDIPILCIEFDGLQQGINVGQKYHPKFLLNQPEWQSVWRKDITELKLKVAHGSMFPFFVMGSEYFDDLSQITRLMIVDGVIGEVIANRARKKIFNNGFNPEDVGLTKEQFELLLPCNKNEVIQDWMIGIECDADMENNPIVKKRWQLYSELDCTSYSSKYLSYPSADDALTISGRAEMLKNAILHGCQVILHTQHFGDVEAKFWMANFNTPEFSGFGLGEDIAMIKALEKLKRLSASNKV